MLTYLHGLSSKHVDGESIRYTLASFKFSSSSRRLTVVTVGLKQLLLVAEVTEKFKEHPKPTQMLLR